ncbi:hypothetical protein [Dietzia sp. 179-F 9C3 NHS]|uniref:hypothetical protein n=1 Tax=Dietzia sp. 179-F 9C3 NHS TaxID=3374295 RepID=UPI00387942C9
MDEGTFRACLVGLDGSSAGCELTATDGTVLSDLRARLGCDWVERIQIGAIPGTGLVLEVWLDEEGMYNQPANPVLEAMLTALRGPLAQRLYGPAVFAAGSLNGEGTESLPEGIIEQLAGLASALAAAR